jgi:hypothetical protein
MAVSKKTSTPTAKSAKPRAGRRKAVPTHDAIAVRAYELYLDRAEGDEVAHWLQAERELTPA